MKTAGRPRSNNIVDLRPEARKRRGDASPFQRAAVNDRPMEPASAKVIPGNTGRMNRAASVTARANQLRKEKFSRVRDALDKHFQKKGTK